MKRNIYTFLLPLLFISSCTILEENEELKANNALLIQELDSIKKSDEFLLIQALRYEKAGSINEAKKNYEELNSNHAHPIIQRIAKNHLAFLNDNSVQRKITAQLEGSWFLFWEGTNWGTARSKKHGNANQMIRFKDGKVQYIESNRIIRETQYELIGPRSESILINSLFALEPDYEKMLAAKGVVTGLIRFKDNQESLLFELNREELTFRIPNCICGCLTYEYQKEKSR